MRNQLTFDFEPHSVLVSKTINLVLALGLELGLGLGLELGFGLVLGLGLGLGLELELGLFRVRVYSVTAIQGLQSKTLLVRRLSIYTHLHKSMRQPRRQSPPRGYSEDALVSSLTRVVLLDPPYCRLERMGKAYLLKACRVFGYM